MKKTLLVIIVTALFAAGAYARTRPHGGTQSLSFDDLGTGGGTATSGTYNSTDTFSFDVFVTYAGYNSTRSLLLVGSSEWHSAQSQNIIGDLWDSVSRWHSERHQRTV